MLQFQFFIPGLAGFQNFHVTLPPSLFFCPPWKKLCHRHIEFWRHSEKAPPPLPSPFTFSSNFDLGRETFARNFMIFCSLLLRKHSAPNSGVGTQIIMLIMKKLSLENAQKHFLACFLVHSIHLAQHELFHGGAIIVQRTFQQRDVETKSAGVVQTIGCCLASCDCCDS